MLKLLVLRNVFLPLYFKFYNVLLTVENNILLQHFWKFFPEPLTGGLTAPQAPAAEKLMRKNFARAYITIGNPIL